MPGLDSVPLVAITVRFAQSLIGTDAFQEVDTYGLTLPVTKTQFPRAASRRTVGTSCRLAFQLAEIGPPRAGRD